MDIGHGLFRPSSPDTNSCHICNEVFGTGHASNCSVRFRNKFTIEVQRYHDRLDRFYEEVDELKSANKIEDVYYQGIKMIEGN